MTPPNVMDVTDKHGGFTVEVPSGSLWMSARENMCGTLESYDEESFYQGNNDCTLALYKLRSYRYPAMVWLDNKTGERLA